MENNTHEHGEKCCSNLCCGSWHKYHILRWLLGVLILMGTFALGYKVGEFKGYFNNDNYDGWHKNIKLQRSHGYLNQNYGPGMMGGGTVFFNEGTLPSIEARPAQPMMYFEQTTTTSPKK